MILSKQQVDALKRLEYYITATDGSATECHEFFCPYNIGECESKDGYIDLEDYYKGKDDGFDSECPRFLIINRKKEEWKCLCGLEILALFFNLDLDDLNDLLKDFDFGYNKKWRSEVAEG